LLVGVCEDMGEHAKMAGRRGKRTAFEARISGRRIGTSAFSINLDDLPHE
jgi:hypothetical protein